MGYSLRIPSMSQSGCIAKLCMHRAINLKHVSATAFQKSLVLWFNLSTNQITCITTGFSCMEIAAYFRLGAHEPFLVAQTPVMMPFGNINPSLSFGLCSPWICGLSNCAYHPLVGVLPCLLIPCHCFEVEQEEQLVPAPKCSGKSISRQ